ncbi:hypothetical protein NBRC116592_24480 [Colwellia sp. KU-HH00111]|uniref:antibiotic biosynthesis monooxygenase family protein n=1 Tax=Colwellia sp. KU-HH00111 TaxID=3127652 RepID=UPI003102A98C
MNSKNKTMGYVAINNIICEPSYIERMEYLFSTRAREIDNIPGFQHMEVLKPMASQDPDAAFLVISHWDSMDCFENWTKSEEFKKGHERAFADLKKAKESGQKPPMMSTFGRYEIISN